ncbi:hypothetical protein M422DRAFT_56563 [Sphaerobolus stellatus SS14]|uniref:Uncharacterized protein n=1 Tax=Sphaerobolus stellatus (strain SS14) TaxID=990650 RepID=A0A0C9TQ49_SPHS4|nr:hypothetical protein M422DRAFT_56563 [Sphaerobolus stellatus SS14]
MSAPQLSNIHIDYYLHCDVTTFRYHTQYAANGVEGNILDPAQAGRLWSYATDISSYITRASLSNRVQVVTKLLHPTAYLELGLPSPGISDPRATGFDNPFRFPPPMAELRKAILRFRSWIKDAADWIVIAKHATYLCNGQTRWVWPDAPQLSLPNNQELILHPSAASSIQKSVMIHPSVSFRARAKHALILHPNVSTWARHRGLHKKHLPLPTTSKAQQGTHSDVEMSD